MLSILYDVIRDVIDEHVYIRQIWLIGQFRKRLASVTAMNGGHIEQHFSGIYILQE